MKTVQRVYSIFVVLILVLGVFAFPAQAPSPVHAEDAAPAEPTQEPTQAPAEPTVAPTEEMTLQPTEPPEIVPLYEASEDKVVVGQYIVVYKDELQGMSAMSSTTSEVEAAGGEILYTYAAAINGFSAKLNDEVLNKLRQDPNLAYIEEDQKISVSDDENGEVNTQSIETGIPSWGIDRIDQRFLPLDDRYYYPSSSGVGVHVYVVDTGIRFDHEQFGGRAVSGYDFVNYDADASDCDGHGTHVAGTIGGTTVGVAKNVSLIAVRVLDCGGNGTISQVLAGIDWVAANAVKPAVANMSLGGGASTSIDTAVKNAINKGITFVVASGNDGYDACLYSPARVSSAITVGATDSSDRDTSFSNYGSCLDLYAPGAGITSSTITNTNTYESWNGTSMATPHVTGAVALYLAGNPTASPATVASAIITNSTKNVIYFPYGQGGSPNRLLYTSNAVPTTAPTLVSPISGFFTNDYNPDISWSTKYNSDSYDYQVSSSSTFSTLTVTGNTLDKSVTLPDLVDGKYYWRVRGVNAYNDATPWSASRYFTIDTAKPEIPLLVKPVAESGVNIKTPALAVGTVAGAKTYEYKWALNEGDLPASPLGTTTKTSTSYTLTALQALPYGRVYWQARAIDAAGNASPWSVPQRFNVTIMKTPANLSFTTSTKPVFTWVAVSGALGYQFQLADNEDFISPIDLPLPPSTSYTPPSPLGTGKYYWRVKTNGGEWMLPNQFTITTPLLPAPVLDSPANASFTNAPQPHFSWNPVAGGSVTYELWVDRQSTFTAPVDVMINDLVGTTATTPTALADGKYYWKVRAINYLGVPGAWSLVRYLTVDTDPPCCRCSPPR